MDKRRGNPTSHAVDKGSEPRSDCVNLGCGIGCALILCPSNGTNSMSLRLFGKSTKFWIIPFVDENQWRAWVLCLGSSGVDLGEHVWKRQQDTADPMRTKVLEYFQGC